MSEQIQRGDVVYVASAAETPLGSEIWAERYAIVVSNDSNNKYCSTVNIVYLTGSKKTRTSPTQIKLQIDNLPVLALCEQIHCIDKCRIRSKKCNISSEEMEQIDAALLISLSLGTKNPIGIFKKWENYIKKHNLIELIEKENALMSEYESEQIIAFQKRQIDRLSKERDGYRLLYESSQINKKEVFVPKVQPL